MRNRKGLAFDEMKQISPNRQYEQHICCSQTFSGWQKKLEKTMKSSWPLIFLPIEYSPFSLCFKTKTNAPFMYKVPGQRHDKKLKHSPICLWQSVVVFQKTAWRKLFQTLSTG